jgi:serine/threonine-protein kinase
MFAVMGAKGTGSTAGETIAGRYVVVSELARGGMGIVYRVDDRATGRPLALKRSLGDDTLASESNSALLEREYRTLVWLRHPRIIQVHDFGTDDQGSFYTMELLDGSDLRAKSPLGWQEVCAHLRDVASSLALLHSRRLVHRDVTPRNIRLTGEGRAKLIDFGALASFGRSSVIAGTPTSVAPEALEGNDIDHRADLFALGAVAYYALTGRHAYPAADLEGLASTWARGAPPPPSAVVPTVPERLDELVLSLLSLDRSLRPSSAAEVMDRLAAIAGLPAERDTGVARSYLVSQELIGRERELARVATRLERAIGARGGACVFDGEPGLGKSALLDRIASDARVSGATVLRVSARVHQTPFGACRALSHQAVQELGERARSIASYHRVLAPEAPPRGERSGQLAGIGSIPPTAIEPKFVDFFLELTVASPLVMLVDDLHHADSLSVSVFTRLAKAATHQRLLLVAAVDTSNRARSGAALTAFRRAALRMRLRPLTEEQTTHLVRCMFGEIAATRRLGPWIQMHTAGNPGLSAELLGHLVDQGRIHYAEGTWVLPNELPQEDVDAIVTSATRTRLERLPKDMRHLAECLSPYNRGSVDPRICRALRDFDTTLADSDIDSLLDGLVYEGILVGDENGHVFAQPRVREMLYAGLDSDRRRRLHAFIAARLAEVSDRDPERAFDIGCHLLAAGDVIGARAHIGPSVVEIVKRPDALVRAVPQLRELLALYGTTRTTADERLAVISALVVAGYYVDPRCHDDFGDAAATRLYRMSGFHVANRFLWLGTYPALAIGILFGFLRIVWQWLSTIGRHGLAILPNGSRSPLPSFIEIMHAFVGVCAARSAVAYLRLEPRTHQFLLEMLAPTGRLPEDNGLRLVHDLISIGVAEVHGDFEKACEGYHDQLRRIPRVRLFTESSRHQYEAGVLCSLGRVALVQAGELTLQCADRVDAMGGEHYRIFAQALRRAHFLYRGHTKQAKDAEDRLDAMAARYGYRWVPDTVAILDLVPYHLAGDLVGLKRVLYRIQEVLPFAPTLGSYRDIVRAMYEGHRGQPERALARYEELGTRIAPFEHPAWSHAHAHKAECLNALGRHDEALEVCEQALRHVGRRSRTFPIAYEQLERESALALAGLGRAAEAAARLDELLDFHGEESHPLLRGLLHRDRARVAATAGDPDAAATHCQAACAEFAVTGNPTLLAQARRLAAQFAPVELAPSTSSEERVPREISLLNSVAGQRHAVVVEHALEHVARLSGASRAFLYTIVSGSPVFAGALQEDDEPEASLEKTVVEWLAAVHDDSPPTSGPTSVRRPLDPPEPTLLPLIPSNDPRGRPVGVLALYGCEKVHELTPGRLSEIAAALRGSVTTAVEHRAFKS